MCAWNINIVAILTLLPILCSANEITSDNSHLSQDSEVNGTESKILSRRKRFLVFPDGSSVQMVFETQNHGYLQVGDIVWFSNTAALAWDLPKDPNIFYFFKNGEKDFQALRRGDDVRHIYYLDAKGRVIDKVPYTKKFITPVFGKRSVDNNKLLDKQMDSETVKLMHKKQKVRDYLKTTDLSDSSIEFHRNARTGLYEKLEKYLEHLGWKGRNCVLKMLCESGKEKHFQGSFFEEILRAVFTLPKGKKFENTNHQEYDNAHTSSQDCDDLYPDCIENETGLPQQFDINLMK